VRADLCDGDHLEHTGAQSLIAKIAKESQMGREDLGARPAAFSESLTARMAQAET
jgi:hypothetical protein